MEASAKVSVDKEGKRTKYLAKYGYPRLVGTGGIFYADQVSSPPPHALAAMHRITGISRDKNIVLPSLNVTSAAVNG